MSLILNVCHSFFFLGDMFLFPALPLLFSFVSCPACDFRPSKLIDPNERIPCGIAAAVHFNDSFELKMTAAYSSRHSLSLSSSPSSAHPASAASPAEPKDVPLRKEGITWRSDRSSFKDQKNEYISIGSEDFIVWMKPAALPKFRKMYAVLDNGLDAGEYDLLVTNNYNVTKYPKRVVFAQHSFFGGKNNLYGYIYLGTGGICLILGILVTLKSVLCPFRDPFDQPLPLEEEDEEEEEKNKKEEAHVGEPTQESLSTPPGPSTPSRPSSSVVDS